MRKQPLVDPGIPFFQFFGSHVLRPENGVGRVVQVPVAVEQTPVSFHLMEKRGRRIWRQNVERSTFQAILLYPVSGRSEGVAAVVIEAEYE
jgi:hypothetical protein